MNHLSGTLAGIKYKKVVSAILNARICDKHSNLKIVYMKHLNAARHAEKMLIWKYIDHRDHLLNDLYLSWNGI